jgi:hypothetical protein
VNFASTLIGAIVENLQFVTWLEPVEAVPANMVCGRALLNLA